MATAREEVNKAQPIFTGSEGWPCSMVFLLSSMLPRSMYLKQDLGKIHPLPSGNMAIAIKRVNKVQLTAVGAQCVLASLLSPL